MAHQEHPDLTETRIMATHDGEAVRVSTQQRVAVIMTYSEYDHLQGLLERSQRHTPNERTAELQRSAREARAVRVKVGAAPVCQGRPPRHVGATVGPVDEEPARALAVGGGS